MTARTPLTEHKKTDILAAAREEAEVRKASRRGLVPGAQAVLTSHSPIDYPEKVWKQERKEIQNKSKDTDAHINMHSSLLFKEMSVI